MLHNPMKMNTPSTGYLLTPRYFPTACESEMVFLSLAIARLFAVRRERGKKVNMEGVVKQGADGRSGRPRPAEFYIIH